MLVADVLDETEGVGFLPDIARRADDALLVTTGVSLAVDAGFNVDAIFCVVKDCDVVVDVLVREFTPPPCW